MHLSEMPDIQRVLSGMEEYGLRLQGRFLKDYMSYSLSSLRGASMSNYIGEHHRDY